MQPDRLSELIKTRAYDLGFERCGMAPAAPLERGPYLQQWLARGSAGSMNYLHKYLDERMNPALLLSGARSIIVTALSYHQPSAEPPTLHGSKKQTGHEISVSQHGAPHGRIATYAWGEDYHVVVKDKLFALMRQLRADLPEPFEYRVCVDTAPLIEREAAARAGIGWIGKNTLVLHPSIGSYFFLGAVVTTLDLALDQPVDDHCGTCTACLDACPTQAFPTPYEMDASRCISYLTIEHRGEIAPELAGQMNDWLFGCDVCQQVCPFNRHASAATEPRFAPRPPAPALPVSDILDWTPEDYRRILRGTAMKRAKFDMWKRNAEIVAKNSDTPDNQRQTI